MKARGGLEQRAYRAELLLLQGVEGELQLSALVPVQVLPPLPQLLLRGQHLRLQQHSWGPALAGRRGGEEGGPEETERERETERETETV